MRVGNARSECLGAVSRRLGEVEDVELEGEDSTMRDMGGSQPGEDRDDNPSATNSTMLVVFSRSKKTKKKSQVQEEEDSQFFVKVKISGVENSDSWSKFGNLCRLSERSAYA